MLVWDAVAGQPSFFTDECRTADEASAVEPLGGRLYPSVVSNGAVSDVASGALRYV